MEPERRALITESVSRSRHFGNYAPEVISETGARPPKRNGGFK